ncbi:MAG: hypothetical protein R3C25_10790 [Hyphomonadaceae bacterium]
MIRSWLVVAALALSACATAAAPIYGAALSPTGAGYSETQIESNRYFVTYRAPRGAEAGLLQDYALLRAAELTLQNQHEWFWVDRRTTDEQEQRQNGPSIGVGIGGGSWGRHSGGGVGVGVTFPIGGQSAPVARSTMLEIRFGDGPKPDDANAYDARSVAGSIRARMAPGG